MTDEKPVGDQPASSPDAPDDSNSAPTSSAGEGDTKESLLQVVEKLVDVEDDDVLEDLDAPKEDSPASNQDEPKTPDGEKAPDAKADEPEKSDKEDEAEEEDDGAELPDDPTQEELASLKPKVRRRINRLLHERAELRGQVERFGKFTDLVDSSGVREEDLDVVIGLAAALSTGDFKTFLEGVTPYVDIAQQTLGIALPEDLQKQVQDGFVSSAAAKELAQRRMQVQHQKAALKAERERSDARDRQNLRTSVTDAIVTWETSIRQRDADYGLKAGTVKRFSQALVQERGQPRTREEALQILEQAYKEANEIYRQANPDPTPKPTQKEPSGSQSSTNDRAEPTTMYEAGLAGLQKARSSAR